MGSNPPLPHFCKARDMKQEEEDYYSLKEENTFKERNDLVSPTSALGCNIKRIYTGWK